MSAEVHGAVPDVERQWRRLHPSSWLFRSLSLSGYALAFPLLFLLRDVGELWLLAFGVAGALSLLVAGYAVLAHLRYRYRLGREEIVVREGVLVRNERRIPYGRVQNVDFARNPLHRLFGVTALRLETASGGTPEAVMRVLSLDAAEQVRKAVEDARVGRTEGSAAPVHALDGDEETLLELPPAELVRFGLVSNQGLVLVGILLALVNRFVGVDWGEVDWTGFVGSSLGLEAQAAANSWWVGALAAVAVLVGILGALYGLSIALAFLLFHGFRLSAADDRLRSEFGSITRIVQITPTRRIQRLRVRDGVLHRLLGRRAIRMDIAGGLPEPGDMLGGLTIGLRQWLAPLIPDDRVPRVLALALPDVDITGREWQPIDRRAARRRLRLQATLLVVAAAAGVLATPWALLSLAGLPLLPWLARRYVACRFYDAGDAALFWRRGWWRRELTIVPYSRMQAIKVTQSPFDRRYGMACLRVDAVLVVGRPYAMRIPYLAVDAARALAARLNGEMAGRSFEWA